MLAPRRRSDIRPHRNHSALAIVLNHSSSLQLAWPLLLPRAPTHRTRGTPRGAGSIRGVTRVTERSGSCAKWCASVVSCGVRETDGHAGGGGGQRVCVALASIDAFVLSINILSQSFLVFPLNGLLALLGEAVLEGLLLPHLPRGALPGFPCLK